ncbi:MAG: hypothetical protein M1819_001843 [Sarea resinae]|nr:MAG: hypothetical protein M1819_001843 [Sarea resinae]
MAIIRHHVLLQVLLSLLLAHLSMGLKMQHNAENLVSGASQEANGRGTAALMSLIQASDAHQPEVFGAAMKLLDSMKSASSCYSRATATLLTSCQSLEGSAPNEGPLVSGSEATLDEIKSTYAARLAVCELLGAGTAVPPNCSPMIPPHQSKAKPKFGFFSGGGSPLTTTGGEIVPYPLVDDKHLRQCLKSLESRPQWWTSYSNARQNAVVMCQAARTGVEKDELIELHKSMAGVASNASAALADAVNNSNRQLQKQRNFAEAVNTLQTRLLHTLESLNSRTRSYFDHIFRDFGAALQSMTVQLSTAGEIAKANLGALNENINQSADKVDGIREALNQAFQEILRSSVDVTTSQQKARQDEIDLVLEVQTSLETMRGRDMQGLLKAFGSLHSKLQLTNELVGFLHSRQDLLDKRLENLDLTFSNIEERAAIISAAQLHQAELQSRLHDSLQTDIRIAETLITQVMTKAANLQETIEETATKLKSLSLLGSFGSVAGRWSWLVVLLVGVCMTSRKAAGYVAIITGAFFAAYSLRLPDLLNYVHSGIGSSSTSLALSLSRDQLRDSMPKIAAIAIGLPILAYIVHKILHYTRRLQLNARGMEEKNECERHDNSYL